MDRLKYLKELKDTIGLQDTLDTIAELMIQVKEDRLSGATYNREFKHDRLSIKVTVEKKNPHN